GWMYPVSKTMVLKGGKCMGHRKSGNVQGAKRNCEKVTLEEAKKLNAWATFLQDDPSKWTARTRHEGHQQLRMEDFSSPIRASRGGADDAAKETGACGRDGGAAKHHTGRPSFGHTHRNVADPLDGVGRETQFLW